MKPLSFKRHRYLADAIRHAVWLYFRFSLSLRNVEELLAKRHCLSPTFPHYSRCDLQPSTSNDI